MQVLFRALDRMNDSLREEIDAAVLDVMHGGKFILGEHVALFEICLAAYLGRNYAVGTGCGTDSLRLALQAAGVGPGKAVLAPAFTLTASVSGIRQLGATPRFLDIDSRTYNVSPEALWSYLEQASDNRPVVLIVVHLYGQSADMDPILDICNHYGVTVIEDCCQSIGALYPSRHGMVKVGKMGLMSCFSFFPTKPLGGMGDGGAVVTDDPDLAAHLRKLRQHGWDVKNAKYVNHDLGSNSRLDAIQAAVLRAKLPHLDGWVLETQRIAEGYDEHLHAQVTVPAIPFGRKSHAYHLYTVRVRNRDLLKCDLKNAGVASDAYFPITMVDQPVFSSYRRDVPHAVLAAQEVLSLPIYPGMTPEEQKHVVDTVNANV